MILNNMDWAIVIAFFIFILAIGVIVSRRAGKNSSEFFLSGRNMPWWLLGISMVATTFSTDTPNLVTDLVRTHGVAGNWLWWAFLLTGMLTVFVYAKLWRRSKVMTDVEFYEIRYSGKPAAFLRGFRAIYLGVFFNVMIMGGVTLAAIKIGGVLLNISPVKSVVFAMIVTLIFSSLGGLRAVLITDFLLFVIAIFGAIIAAVYAVNLPEVGGIQNLFSNPNVVDKINILPNFNNWEELLMLLIIPIAVQWWSVWYPGSEPGGGGYLAQRMLSAKDEKNAVGATFFFNAAHYALRPWPWILVALASLIVFPDLNALQQAFPHVDAAIIKNDLAYPAMLTFLPHGLLGVVVVSLIAAYISTISTHLNWGSSYIVNDFYKRFIKPDASDKEQVLVGRISTAILMLLAICFSLLLSNALQAFQILLQIGAGTGLIFILRWFWWRINAFTEIAGMVISFIVAIYLEILHIKFGFAPIPSHIKLIVGVAITTIGWVTVTLLTRPTSDKILIDFYKLVFPGGKGWNYVLKKAESLKITIKNKPQKGDITNSIALMFVSTISVYSFIFAVGYFFYSQILLSAICFVMAAASAIIIFKLWKNLEMK